MRLLPRFHRRPRRCDLYMVYGLYPTTCGLPAVACVAIFEAHHNICAWHLEPLDVYPQTNGSLAFLARSFRRAPADPLGVAAK